MYVNCRSSLWASICGVPANTPRAAMLEKVQTSNNDPIKCAEAQSVICRDKALATISADGILLVLASMIDNMPYVLAEASVMRIPLLIYDVGGVTEMIDPKQHADIICGTPKVGRPTGSPATPFRVCGLVPACMSWLAAHEPGHGL